MSEHAALPMAKYKLVFLGDIAVGKTSLINRFMYDSFDSTYQATVGIDFLSKTMFLGDRSIRLQMWDTAGQERFRTLIPNYIRDSHIAIVVFDVTNPESFNSLDKWLEDVRNERGMEANIIVVGNKTDKEDERSVSSENAQKKTIEFSAEYIETSARTGDNIQELFNKVAIALPHAERISVDNNDVINIRAQAAQSTIESNKCKC